MNDAITTLEKRKKVLKGIIAMNIGAKPGEDGKLRKDAKRHLEEVNAALTLIQPHSIQWMDERARLEKENRELKCRLELLHETIKSQCRTINLNSELIMGMGHA